MKTILVVLFMVLSLTFVGFASAGGDCSMYLQKAVLFADVPNNSLHIQGPSEDAYMLTTCTMANLTENGYLLGEVKFESIFGNLLDFTIPIVRGPESKQEKAKENYKPEKKWY